MKTLKNRDIEPTDAKNLFTTENTLYLLLKKVDSKKYRKGN